MNTWQNEENKYKLESPFDGLYIWDYPKYVKFTTQDPVKYPVPSRTYLDIHAACARIAHLSVSGVNKVTPFRMQSPPVSSLLVANQGVSGKEERW